MAIQEALEEESTKDTPSFGKEDLDEIHRSGLLGIYNFPGAVYATDGSNDKEVMGAGYYRLDENRGGSASWVKARKAIPPMGLN